MIPTDDVYEYTWKKKEILGLRLNIEGNSIKVLYLQPSAPSKIRDITGWYVSSVNGEALTAESLSSAKSAIKSERPLTLQFRNPNAASLGKRQEKDAKSEATPVNKKEATSPMMWKVQKEGELEKQSSGMFTTWNTHNFKLKNGAFWYVRKDGEASDFSIPVASCKVKDGTFLTHADGPRIFEVAVPGKKLVLRASNQEERDDWVNTLRKAMEELKSPGGDSDVEAEEGGEEEGKETHQQKALAGTPRASSPHREAMEKRKKEMAELREFSTKRQPLNQSPPKVSSNNQSDSMLLALAKGKKKGEAEAAQKKKEVPSEAPNPFSSPPHQSGNGEVVETGEQKDENTTTKEQDSEKTGTEEMYYKEIHIRSKQASLNALRMEEEAARMAEIRALKEASPRREARTGTGSSTLHPDEKEDVDAVERGKPGSQDHKKGQTRVRFMEDEEMARINERLEEEEQERDRARENDENSASKREYKSLGPITPRLDDAVDSQGDLLASASAVSEFGGSSSSSEDGEEEPPSSETAPEIDSHAPSESAASPTPAEKKSTSVNPFEMWDEDEAASDSPGGQESPIQGKGPSSVAPDEDPMESPSRLENPFESPPRKSPREKIESPPSVQAEFDERNKRRTEVKERIEEEVMAKEGALIDSMKHGVDKEARKVSMDSVLDPRSQLEQHNMAQRANLARSEKMSHVFEEKHLQEEKEKEVQKQGQEQEKEETNVAWEVSGISEPSHAANDVAPVVPATDPASQASSRIDAELGVDDAGMEEDVSKLEDPKEGVEARERVKELTARNRELSRQVETLESWNEYVKHELVEVEEEQTKERERLKDEIQRLTKELERLTLANKATYEDAEERELRLEVANAGLRERILSLEALDADLRSELKVALEKQLDMAEKITSLEQESVQHEAMEARLEANIDDRAKQLKELREEQVKDHELMKAAEGKEKLLEEEMTVVKEKLASHEAREAEKSEEWKGKMIEIQNLEALLLKSQTELSEMNRRYEEAQQGYEKADVMGKKLVGLVETGDEELAREKEMRRAVEGERERLAGERERLEGVDLQHRHHKKDVALKMLKSALFRRKLGEKLSSMRVGIQSWKEHQVKERSETEEDAKKRLQVEIRRRLQESNQGLKIAQDEAEKLQKELRAVTIHQNDLKQGKDEAERKASVIVTQLAMRRTRELAHVLYKITRGGHSRLIRQWHLAVTRRSMETYRAKAKMLELEVSIRDKTERNIDEGMKLRTRRLEAALSLLHVVTKYGQKEGGLKAEAFYNTRHRWHTETRDGTQSRYQVLEARYAALEGELKESKDRYEVEIRQTRGLVKVAQGEKAAISGAMKNVTDKRKLYEADMRKSEMEKEELKTEALKLKARVLVQAVQRSVQVRCLLIRELRQWRLATVRHAIGSNRHDMDVLRLDSSRKDELLSCLKERHMAEAKTLRRMFALRQLVYVMAGFMREGIGRAIEALRFGLATEQHRRRLGRLHTRYQGEVDEVESRNASAVRLFACQALKSVLLRLHGAYIGTCVSNWRKSTADEVKASAEDMWEDMWTLQGEKMDKLKSDIRSHVQEAEDRRRELVRGHQAHMKERGLREIGRVLMRFRRDGLLWSVREWRKMQELDMVAELARLSTKLELESGTVTRATEALTRHEESLIRMEAELSERHRNEVKDIKDELYGTTEALKAKIRKDLALASMAAVLRRLRQTAVGRALKDWDKNRHEEAEEDSRKLVQIHMVQVECLQTQMGTIQDEKESLRLKLLEEDATGTTLADQIKKKEDEYTRKEEELRHWKDSLGKSQEELREEVLRGRELERDLQRARSEKEAEEYKSEVRVNEVKTETQGAILKNSSKIMKLQSELSGKNQQLEEREEKIQTLEKELHLIQEAHAEALKAKVDLQEEMDSEMEATAVLTQQLREAQTLNRGNTWTRPPAAEAASLVGENATLRAELERLRAAHRSQERVSPLWNTPLSLKGSFVKDTPLRLESLMPVSAQTGMPRKGADGTGEDDHHLAWALAESERMTLLHEKALHESRARCEASHKEISLLREEMSQVREDALFYVAEYEKELNKRTIIESELNHIRLLKQVAPTQEEAREEGERERERNPIRPPQKSRRSDPGAKGKRP